jgi:hypothetical protein
MLCVKFEKCSALIMALKEMCFDLKFRVFWDVEPVTLKFTEVSEAVCTSEMSVNFNVTTRHCIPED